MLPLPLPVLLCAASPVAVEALPNVCGLPLRRWRLDPPSAGMAPKASGAGKGRQAGWSAGEGGWRHQELPPDRCMVAAFPCTTHGFGPGGWAELVEAARAQNVTLKHLP